MYSWLYPKIVYRGYFLNIQLLSVSSAFSHHYRSQMRTQDSNRSLVARDVLAYSLTHRTLTTEWEAPKYHHLPPRDKTPDPHTSQGRQCVFGMFKQNISTTICWDRSEKGKEKRTWGVWNLHPSQAFKEILVQQPTDLFEKLWWEYAKYRI